MTTRPRPARGHRYTVPLANPQLLRDVCGPAHSHLQLVEQAFADEGVRVDSQGGEIVVTGEGEGARQAADALQAFARRIANGAEATAAELEAAIRLTASHGVAAASGDVIQGLRKPIMAQTPGQRAYLEKLRSDELGLIFGVGPAGTGKTYLAVAMAAAELKAGKRERLVVARPAVEAGEKLGFLPGALEEKVDPYMLPIWDALNECLGAQEVDRRKERREIEVAPLAFMRGRTLKNAFVIIDEAQNATIPQMKMVLTRLGRGSRMVVTGDPSQTDLPSNLKSGLAHAMSILRNVKGVAIETLTRADVVRHELVGRIVDAYEKDAAKGRLAQVIDASSQAPLSVDVRIADPRWDVLGDAEALAGKVLAHAAAHMKTGGELSLLLTADNEMQALNRQWRGLDKPTDVLSFPADDPEIPGQPQYLGDIALGFETSAADARTMGRDLEGHISHLMIHGFLHLLGYDHIHPDDAKVMEPLETQILAGLGWPDPYATGPYAGGAGEG